LKALEAYKKCLTEIATLGSALSILSWDQQTNMPKKGIAARSQVAGKLSKMAFELSVSDELGRYIEDLESQPDLSEIEKASVARVGKEYRRHKAIPPEVVEELTITRSQAQSAWVKAREASDFSQFEPLLAKMVSFQQRFAEYFGYEEHPYDALLEGFEPGLTVKKLKGIIEPLRKETVPFLKRLMAEGTAPDTSILDGSFDIDAQRALTREALELITYDFDAGNLSDVAHPFTITIAPGDVRVTNRYLEKEIFPGLFGALHEGGHALYNQGMPEELFYLELANGSSNGIHESQSRMIENLIGRSLPFWTYFQPQMAKHFPQFASTSPEALFGAANVVRPSLIRVEADEVTYNFHIMVRFELERGLIDGSVRVADLPRLWNEAMEEYVGVVPPNDALGVLQDVHWSMGMFGYFPSYMLGNLYAAQLYTSIREAIPSLDDQIQSGNLRPLVEWLRENVHRHGGVYEPDELMQRITGSSLDSSHYVRYVVDKYSDIYAL